MDITKYHNRQSGKLLEAMGLAQCDRCNRPRPKAGVCGWCITQPYS